MNPFSKQKNVEKKIGLLVFNQNFMKIVKKNKNYDNLIKINQLSDSR